MRGQAAINTEDQQSIVSVYKQSTLNSPSAVAGAKVDQPSTLRLLGHFLELRTDYIQTGAIRSRPSVRQLADEASIFFAPQLFVDDFDLLINYLPGKPVDRHMHPVALLAFDVEFCQVGFARRTLSALRNHINE